MVACSFCKENYEFPKGITVIQKDSSTRYFCSSKCRKNSEMGRVSKKVKWVRKSDVVKAETKKREEFRAVKRAAAEKDSKKTIKKKKR